MFATSTFARNALGAAGAALFAATCLVAAAGPAAAAPVTASKIVSYADLNLAKAQGRAVLQARIKSAAKAVCSTGSNDTLSRGLEDRCVRNAVANASTARS